MRRRQRRTRLEDGIWSTDECETVTGANGRQGHVSLKLYCMFEFPYVDHIYEKNLLSWRNCTSI